MLVRMPAVRISSMCKRSHVVAYLIRRWTLIQNNLSCKCRDSYFW